MLRTFLAIQVLFLMVPSVLCAQNRKHAFFVGVETYDPVFLRRLKYAEDDATALANSFEKLGYRVTLMTRDAEIPGRRPSSADNIIGQLELWAKSIQPGDTAVIGFSGHGVQFKDAQQLADGTTEDQFFCPEEAKLTDVNTLLSIKKVYALLDECKADRKLLLVDACRNEVLSDIGKSATRIDLDPVGVTRRSVPKGIVALYSCAAGEKSYELDEYQHGVFCYQVLKYLRGEAPSSEYRSDTIQLRDLLSYASIETRRVVFDKLALDQFPESEGRTTDWEIGQIPARKEQTNSIGMKLRLIPAGTFMMGSKESINEILANFPSEPAEEHENELPQHQVTISKPFYMGVHEVTVGQFRQFINATRYRTDVESGRGRNNPTGAGTSVAAQNWRNPGHPGLTEDHPVTVVTYTDAQEFCRWLSKREGVKARLPTQAEWEYACRAGTSTRYFSGDDPEGLVSVANVPNREDYFVLHIQASGIGPLLQQNDPETGEISFTGSSRNGYRLAEKNTGNRGNRVTLLNDTSDITFTIRTRGGDVVLPPRGSQTVSLPKEPQWVDREFEVFLNRSIGWRKFSCPTGAEIQCEYDGARWQISKFSPHPDAHRDGVVILRNVDNQSAVYFRINGEQVILAAGEQRVVSPGEVRHPWFIEGGDGFQGLAPVGQYLPNAFGLFDMHGNVWEWCQDGLDGYAYSTSAKLDPIGKAKSSLYAIRGGCFL